MRMRWIGAATMAVALALASAAQAFDTGPHANITEQAMAMQGFNRPAADVVQVENWLTDYFTSRPAFPDQCALEKLHFDSVYTQPDVEAYWNTLLDNTVDAARKAADANDVIGFYAVLGVSLHVVQDFYTHSDWVESSGQFSGAYDTTTWFQWRRSHPARRTPVFTGWYQDCVSGAQGSHPVHGDYASGMNHDSVVRPRYDRAYVYALAASFEWLANLHAALASDPKRAVFWNQALRYSPSAADAAKLASDQAASLYVSEWVDTSGVFGATDGHWNGNHSGYGKAWAAYLAIWGASPDSPYVAAFKTGKPHVALAQGLYAAAGPPRWQAQVFPLDNVRVVRMQVSSVCAGWPLGGTESYFGTLIPTAGGLPDYPVRDASQYHQSCPSTPWQYILVVPSSGSVVFRYAIANENFSGGATTANIYGSSDAAFFSCSPQVCSFDDNGNWRPVAGALTLTGTGFSGVTVKLTLEQQPTAHQ